MGGINVKISMIFLVNPSERNILEDAGDRLPLGILYMANEWKKRDDVIVYDMNHDNMAHLIRDLNWFKPEIVGVSCLTTPMVDQAKIVCKVVKDNSDSQVIVGGYHPTIIPRDFSLLADFIVLGEGEGLDKLEPLEDFQGLNNVIRPRTMNIEQMLPDRTMLDSLKYNMQIKGLKATTAITSRGCPNECVFCGNPNKQVRYHSLNAILSDLETAKVQGYQAVYFLDDVFTIRRQRAKDISQMCRFMGMKFRATTRANYMTQDLIEAFAHNGCITLSMGVESGNEEILERAGKGQTKAHIKDTFRLCGKCGIDTKGFFIIGLPGETEQTARETIEFAKELRQYGMKEADFYPMIPYPGTPIWLNPEKYGINILSKDYSRYLQASKHREINAPCETKGLKSDIINKLVSEANSEWKN